MYLDSALNAVMVAAMTAQIALQSRVHSALEPKGKTVVLWSRIAYALSGFCDDGGGLFVDCGPVLVSHEQHEACAGRCHKDRERNGIVHEVIEVPCPSMSRCEGAPHHTLHCHKASTHRWQNTKQCVQVASSVAAGRIITIAHCDKTA